MDSRELVSAAITAVHTAKADLQAFEAKNVSLFTTYFELVEAYNSTLTEVDQVLRREVHPTDQQKTIDLGGGFKVQRKVFLRFDPEAIVASQRDLVSNHPGVVSKVSSDIAIHAPQVLEAHPQLVLELNTDEVFKLIELGVIDPEVGEAALTREDSVSVFKPKPLVTRLG